MCGCRGEPDELDEPTKRTPTRHTTKKEVERGAQTLLCRSNFLETHGLFLTCSQSYLCDYQ